MRQIQQKLRELGLYSGSVDGVYGTATQKAVRQFQKNCGLTVDGVAGSKTLLYLGLGSGGGSSSAGGYSSSDVYLLAKVIAAEARGESYTGQVAVGAVVLNRVRHSSFPDSISGVACCFLRCCIRGNTPVTVAHCRKSTCLINDA